VTANARLAPTWAAMRTLVAENPNALGYLIGPEVDESVKPLALAGDGPAPPDLRQLVVAAAAGEPGGAARAFVAWAQSRAGQAVVAERHDRLEP
jgi:hypothetical protein